VKINPVEVKPGEPVNVYARITNVGEAQGTYPVNLVINGKVMDSVEVTLSGGQGTMIVFTTSGESFGDYRIEIDKASGNFSVVTPNLWWMWLAIGLGVPIILVTTYLVMRKQK
jgi:hypothetical protein